jgi:hypothetical protein
MEVIESLVGSGTMIAVGGVFVARVGAAMLAAPPVTAQQALVKGARWAGTGYIAGQIGTWIDVTMNPPGSRCGVCGTPDDWESGRQVVVIDHGAWMNLETSVFPDVGWMHGQGVQTSAYCVTSDVADAIEEVLGATKDTSGGAPLYTMDGPDCPEDEISDPFEDSTDPCEDVPGNCDDDHEDLNLEATCNDTSTVDTTNSAFECSATAGGCDTVHSYAYDADMTDADSSKNDICNADLSGCSIAGNGDVCDCSYQQCSSLGGPDGGVITIGN